MALIFRRSSFYQLNNLKGEEMEMEKNIVLSEEEINEIVTFILGQTTVDDVLDIIGICWRYGCNIITPPPEQLAGAGITLPGYLNDIKHLGPIYRHAIRLIESQEEALSVYLCVFFDGISKSESLGSFLVALEFCDSLDNLEYLTEEVLENLHELVGGIFSVQEEILALFEKREELLKLMENKEE